MGDLKLATLVALCIFLSTPVSRAERVGYQFSGAFSGTGCCYTLFDVAGVPRTAPVTGTFSYDTTAPTCCIMLCCNSFADSSVACSATKNDSSIE